MIINGDCLEELDKMCENIVDAIVTDPPYELNFMSKGWDNAGVSFNKETWQKCLRVLKPGGYLLTFGGARTYHRIACAIENAGFEIRDCIMWLYGSGFPKSMNIGLAIDKKKGIKVYSDYICNNKNNVYGKGMGGGVTIEQQKAQNQWKGWGTALKPAFEPIIVARKPFKGSCVDNVMKYGVGGLNIDECRVGNEERTQFSGRFGGNGDATSAVYNGYPQHNAHYETVCGRFPANVILTYDETDFDEVCGGFPDTKGSKTGNITQNPNNDIKLNASKQITHFGFNDSGSAARYFYCAKASKKDRNEGLDEFENIDGETYQFRQDGSLDGKIPVRKNTHPTVKPTALMQYLIRLVAPKGATILDPFMGSGSTGKAAMYENKERNANYKFIGIEKDGEYCKIAEARIKQAGGEE